jgi:arylsulfatase A-like enzyme
MLHVPLIIKPPASSERRPELEAASDELVSLNDLVPTILDMVGLPEMPGQRGRSLFDGGSQVLIAQTHKPEATRNLVCLRDERFKMIYDVDLDEFELYDLEQDPGELVDVFDTRAGERAEWPDQLRWIGERAKLDHALDIEDLDPETLERLKGLGYFGE